jgi:hypothetical protein
MRPKVNRISDLALDLMPAWAYALLMLFVIVLAAFGQYQPPPARLARSLPAAGVQSADLRERHNAALRALLESCAIPTGSDTNSIAVRTSALELLDAAITNGIELADGSTSAGAVAGAAADYVQRRVLSSTNSVQGLGGATNAPTLIPMRGSDSMKAEFSGRSLVERRKFIQPDGIRTNRIWKTEREFPVMFERRKKK